VALNSQIAMPSITSPEPQDDSDLNQLPITVELRRTAMVLVISEM
jgi:hypothetical protein